MVPRELVIEQGKNISAAPHLPVPADRKYLLVVVVLKNTLAATFFVVVAADFNQFLLEVSLV